MNHENRVKISNLQFSLLMFSFLYGSSIIINPATGAGRDAWLAVIISWSGGLGLITIYIGLSRLNPGQNLIQILLNHFGKYAGGFIAIMYIWYFTHLAALVTRNFGEFMVATTYPLTPMPVIIISLILLIIYGLRSGLEVIARVGGELLVPIIPIPLIIALIALLPKYDFSSILPVLEHGVKPMINAAFGTLIFPFGETVVFLMIIPHLNKQEKIYKYSYLVFTIICLIFLNNIIRDLSILGPGLFKRAYYTPYIIAQLIPNLSFEPLRAINLFIGVALKTALCLFAAASGLIQLFKLTNYKMIASALTVFTAVLAVWIYRNPMEMFSWAVKIWPVYSVPFQIIIPFILLVISWVKQRVFPPKTPVPAGR
jgi:spore germination protein KB